MKFGFPVAAAAALVLAVTPALAAYRLAPFKDDLFEYPGVIDTAYGGDYVKVDYVESRDLYERDIVPEKKTKPEYVSLEVVKPVERDMTAKEGRVSVQYIATGAVEGGAKAVVLYVHGRGGNRGQGANDWMFGGNFNRIKNLMARNGGVYLSGEFPALNARGVAQAKVLLLEYAKNSPGAPIFVACGSLGGRICWGLAEDDEVAAHDRRLHPDGLDQRRRFLQDRGVQAEGAGLSRPRLRATSSSTGRRRKPSSRNSSSSIRTIRSSSRCSIPARTAPRSA